MLSRYFVPIFLVSSLLAAPSIEASKVAKVRVYRQGRLLTAVSVFADGHRVGALTPRKSSTFYLAPGYHELTMQPGEIGPTASFKAVAGKEYLFELKYGHSVSATSLRDLSMTLSMQPKLTVAAKLGK